MTVKSKFLSRAAVAGVTIAFLAAPLQAQQFKNSQSILQALSPQQAGPTVRSMSVQQKRGINIQGQLPPMMDLPAVSLTVNFELDSADLTTDGMLALRSLAKALLDPKVNGMTFQIAGHTDGRGGAAYNQTLSERRAQAVVEHLKTFYSVPAERMIPIGYGQSRPVDADVLSPLNRRVEIINISPLS